MVQNQKLHHEKSKKSIKNSWPRLTSWKNLRKWGLSPTVSAPYVWQCSPCCSPLGWKTWVMGQVWGSWRVCFSTLFRLVLQEKRVENVKNWPTLPFFLLGKFNFGLQVDVDFEFALNLEFNTNWTEFWGEEESYMKRHKKKCRVFRGGKDEFKEINWDTTWAMKNPSYLGYIGGFTTQSFRDYNKSLYIRIPIKQPVLESKRVFFRGSHDQKQRCKLQSQP